MSPRLHTNVIAISVIAFCAAAGAQQDPYKPGAPAPNSSAVSQGTVQPNAGQPMNIDPNAADTASQTGVQPGPAQVDPNAEATRDYDNTGFQDEVRAYQERQQALNVQTAPRTAAEARQQELARQQQVTSPGVIERDVRGPARYDVFPPSADDAYDLSGLDDGTGAFVDPQTGAVIDRQTGAVVDPQTGALIDPQTGAVLDRQTASETARQRDVALRDQNDRFVDQPTAIDRADRGPARYDVFPPSADDRYDFTNRQPSATNVPVSPSDINTAPESVTDPNAASFDTNEINPSFQGNQGTRFDTFPTQTESLRMGTPGVPNYDLTPNRAQPNIRTIDPDASIPQTRVAPQQQFPTGFPYYNTSGSGQVNSESSANVNRRNWRQENFNFSNNARQNNVRNMAAQGTAASRGASGASAGSGSASSGASAGSSGGGASGGSSSGSGGGASGGG